MSGNSLEPLSPTSLDLAQQIQAHLSATEEIDRLTSSRSRDLVGREPSSSIALVLDKIKLQYQITQEEKERVRAYYQRLERFSLFFIAIYKAAFPIGEGSDGMAIKSSDPEKEKKVERGLRALLANKITIGFCAPERWSNAPYCLRGASGCLVGQNHCEDDDRMSEIVVADLHRFTYAHARVRTERFNELMEQKREALTRPLAVQEVQRYVSADRKGNTYVEMKWDDGAVPFIGRDIHRFFKRKMKPTMKIPADSIKVGTLYDTGGSQPGPHFLLDSDFQVAPHLARIAQDFGTEDRLKAAVEKHSGTLYKII